MIILLTVILCLIISFLIFTSRTISQRELDSISVGMPLDEVIRILGDPIADVGSGGIIHQYQLTTGEYVYIGYWYDWSDAECVIRVDNIRVEEKSNNTDQ